MRIKITTLRVLLWMLYPLSYWRLEVSRVKIYYNYTSHSGLYRGLAQIGRPPANKTKTVQCNLEEGEFLYRKTPKKFRAPGEDQNNNPPSSSSNHRATGGSMHGVQGWKLFNNHTCSQYLGLAHWIGEIYSNIEITKATRLTV